VNAFMSSLTSEGRCSPLVCSFTSARTRVNRSCTARPVVVVVEKKKAETGGGWWDDDDDDGGGGGGGMTIAVE